MRALKEPLAIAPFLQWFDRRAAYYAQEFSENDTHMGMARVIEDCGWRRDAGARRIHRWRYEHVSGLTERADIEDALDHAGVPIWEVYPDLETPEEPLPMSWRRVGQGRYLTDEQVVAAHTIYMRMNLSMGSVGEMLYERYGHSTPHACAIALGRAFRHFGLPTRECQVEGKECRHAPLDGSPFCLMHEPERRRRVIAPLAEARKAQARAQLAWLTPELLHEARVRAERGMSMLAIADLLLPQTPVNHPKYLARRLTGALEESGWMRTKWARKPKAVDIQEAA